MQHAAVCIAIGKVVDCLGEALVEAAASHGCELTVVNYYDLDARGGYKEIIRKWPNIITWGVKLPVWWYHKHVPAANILFLENGLLCQRAGVWVDSRGWFSESSLCVDREYDEAADPIISSNIRDLCVERFGWAYAEGGNVDGPVMLALQRNRDLSTWFFSAQRPGEKCIDGALRIAMEQGGDRELLVRPHPRESTQVTDSAYWQAHWKLDTSPDVYATLRTCSALVSVNSTLVTEALTLGIPVVALGEGAFTGSLAVKTSFQGLDKPVQQDAVDRYLCAVWRHQVPYKPPHSVCTNAAFRAWASRLR